MLAKYKIAYSLPVNGHTFAESHQMTNDPVACEEFLAELLQRGLKIGDISHEGIRLPRIESDKLIRSAAGMLATRQLCASLDIDSAEAHHRFGSPA